MVMQNNSGLLHNTSFVSQAWKKCQQGLFNIVLFFMSLLFFSFSFFKLMSSCCYSGTWFVCFWCLVSSFGLGILMHDTIIK